MTDWLPLESAVDPAVAGGKAARLGQCLAAGLPVPPGGVVTIAAHRRLLTGETDAAELEAVVGSRLAGYCPGDLFAVRSSAEVEDSAKASFAGQFLSILNVTRDQVPAAVRAVQDSAPNPSAARYARRLGVPAPDALAVIVQVQVPARLAGVCFTVDPVTGVDDILIEYATGLGDKVVGGLAAPAGMHRLHRTGTGAVLLLGDGDFHDEARRVAEMAVALEKRFSAPQDVEWAYADDNLWLLQVRPITTKKGRR